MRISSLSIDANTFLSASLALASEKNLKRRPKESLMTSTDLS